MPVLNHADNIVLGSTEADRVYLGSTRIWETLSAYDLAVLADQPIAYWPCSDLVGNTGKELINGWHGSYQGGVVLAGENTPDGSPAPLFNGSNGYLRIPNTNNRLQPTYDFTAEMWFRAVNYGDYDTIWGFANNDWDARLNPPGNQYTLHWYGTDGVWQDNLMVFAPPTSPVNGNWHHLIICRSSDGNFRRYWDGQPAGVGSISATSPRSMAGRAALGIGATGIPNRYWGGPVCRVAHYNYLLSDMQALAHYNAGV